MRPLKADTLSHRLLAATLAALVWVVSGLAFAPGLHQRLHGHGTSALTAFAPCVSAPPASADTSSHDPAAPATAIEADLCVIALFAQGLDCAWPSAIVAKLSRPDASSLHAAERKIARSPHYRLSPSRGPPATSIAPDLV